jgi:hypothetical protein
MVDPDRHLLEVKIFGATSDCPRTIGSCTGRRPRPTARCCASSSTYDRVAGVFDIGQQQAPAMTCTAAELQAYFGRRRALHRMGRHELAHREQRDAALTSLRFRTGVPAGQRPVEGVFNAARFGRCCCAGATGIGKTVHAVPLPARPVQELDKLFYLIIGHRPGACPGRAADHPSGANSPCRCG